MSLKSLFQIITVCLFSTGLFAQWDSYEATWEGQPGLMMVHMGLKDHAPYAELPYLMSLTQTSLDCDAQGYPSQEFIEESEITLKDIDSMMSRKMYLEDAGRLIHKCSVTDYLYVEDTLKAALWLEENMPGSIGYQFKEDAEWQIYAQFIYPDDFLLQSMTNGRILKTLEEEGILLENKKLLSHFASFKTNEDLHDYRRFLIGLNYKIGEITEDTEGEFPHAISFSRKDRLSLYKLSNTTLRLHQRAQALEGSYDGWEVVIE